VGETSGSGCCSKDLVEKLMVQLKEKDQIIAQLKDKEKMIVQLKEKDQQLEKIKQEIMVKKYCIFYYRELILPQIFEQKKQKIIFSYFKF
jgi:hypothetical protein